MVSLILATMLWMAVANQASSEIGLEVPLEYRNIPAQLEITGDMTKMAAQVPALFEALSGMQMNELFKKVKAIGDKGTTAQS